MLRAAAKNFARVCVVVCVSDYALVAKSVEGGTSIELRKELATKAFDITSVYDAGIHKYFSGSNDSSLNLKYGYRSV